MTHSVYEQLKATTLKLCKDYISDKGLSSTVEIFDYDTHTVVTTWPDKDLFGVGDFSIMNSGGMYVITCSITACTQADDVGLTRLMSIIGGMYDKLKPGEVIGVLVNPTTGAPLGTVTVSGNLALLPVEGTNSRPFQEIAVQLGVSYLHPPVL